MRSQEVAGTYRRRRDDMTLKQLVDTLRMQIGLRQIAPGSELREPMLVKQFNVSRMRAREAILALQERGLVSKTANFSAIVVRLSIKHIHDIYDVRDLLEGSAMRLAVQNSGPGTWDELELLVNKDMPVYAKEKDFDAYLQGIEKFRSEILTRAGNEILRGIIDGLVDQIRGIMHRTIILPGRIEGSIAELIKVVATMQRGDAKEAERLRRAQLRHQREFLEKYKDYVL